MISELYERIAEYESDISKEEEELQTDKDNYYSLKDFKGVEESSHDDVHNILVSKNKALNQLEQYCEHNEVINSYEKGTNSILSKLGYIRVAMMFDFLGLSIDAKLLEYEASIALHKIKIGSYKLCISSLYDEIREGGKGG